MSRSRVPSMLWRLHGIPAPKSIGLRVIEPGPEKEYTGSGLFLGQDVYHSPHMLSDVEMQGYVLVDAHVKMFSKPGNELIKTPVVYLTFNHVDRFQSEEPVAEQEPLIHSYRGLLISRDASFTGRIEMSTWLQRVFRQTIGVIAWLNRPTGKPGMLALNIIQVSSQPSDCSTFNLPSFIWMEDEAAVS